MAINKEAIDYIKNKGLTKGFSYKDVWKEEHAHAFTVAKCMTYDLLSDIQSSLVSALEEGKTYSLWAKEIEQVMISKGWWGKKNMIDPLDGKMKEVQLGSPRRLKTIYNVNMRQAYNVGNYERGQSSKAHTKMMYRVGNSKKHREEHLSWDGLILPKDDPWWDKHMPPNGYGCKCYVKFLTEAGAKRLEAEGIPDENARVNGQPGRTKPVKTTAPLDIPKQYVNKRTGKTYTGIEGITPGFEYNPAIERAKVLEKLLADSSLKYKESSCKVAVKEKYPDVEWRKLADNVYVYKGRINNRKKDLTEIKETEEAKLDKEVLQAKILAKQGHVVYLIPDKENKKGIKQPDAIVDGVTTDFKTIIGTGKQTIRNKLKEALPQAHDLFLKFESDFTLQEVWDKTREELSVRTHNAGRKIYVQLSDGSFYEWDMEEIK